MSETNCVSRTFESVQNIMPGEYMQTIKVALVLAGCSFIGGTVWADWVYDYPVLTHQPDAILAASDHYLRRALAGEAHMYVPLAAVFLAVIGLSAGLALMEEHNLIFDGLCILGILFGVSTHATTVIPGLKSLAATGLKSMTSATDLDSQIETITKIAASHTIVLGIVAGVSVLQIIHFILLKKWAYDANHKPVEAVAAKKKSQ